MEVKTWDEMFLQSMNEHDIPADLVQETLKLIQSARADERDKMLSEPEKWFEIDDNAYSVIWDEWEFNPTMQFKDFLNKPENLKRILRRKP